MQWGGLVLMAGQIGLDPPTMQLVAGEQIGPSLTVIRSTVSEQLGWKNSVLLLWVAAVQTGTE